MPTAPVSSSWPPTQCWRGPTGDLLTLHFHDLPYVSSRSVSTLPARLLLPYCDFQVYEHPFMYDTHGAWLFRSDPIAANSHLSLEGATGDTWDHLDYLEIALHGGHTPHFPCSLFYGLPKQAFRNPGSLPCCPPTSGSSRPDTGVTGAPISPGLCSNTAH